MNAVTPFSRRNLAAALVALGLFAAAGPLVPSVHAEPKQDDAAHQQLCADLYLIYDTNMDIYYDRSNSDQVRQRAYEAAHDALSDMRKQGCKTNVARIDRAGPLSGLELQEVTSAQAQPVASTATTSHLTQLVTR